MAAHDRRNCAPRVERHEHSRGSVGLTHDRSDRAAGVERHRHGGGSGVGLTPTCDLCRAERLTPWYHEDATCWVADCELCDVPMVVWREHGTEPPADVVAHMTARLEDAARTRFAEFYVDAVRRNIPEHWHAHARPSGKAALRWFTSRLTR